MKFNILLTPPQLFLSDAASLLAGMFTSWALRSKHSRRIDVVEEQSPQRSRQFEGVRWFSAGESGVTYRELFAGHLEGANTLSVVDPWIHSFRQIRLFAELLEELSSLASGDINVHLTTSTATGDAGWALGQVKALIDLRETFEARGVHLSVSFDETIHDRWIGTKDWTILLGKGLDIWDPATCYSRPQAQRPISKKFTITYLPVPAVHVEPAPERVNRGQR